MREKWPSRIWVVRHGESAGNVARHAAEAAGVPMVALEARDCDVPLSELGERQADALGRWFGAMPPEEQPTVVLTSPYQRASRTAERIAAHLAPDPPPLIPDERLREREFGVLDRLTKRGVEERHPEQAELRRRYGKFYHRPPGGESWCDIILRLRSVTDSMAIELAEERVLVVCHSVVVLCFRCLFERMTEHEILAIDREQEVANCSVTSYDYAPGRKGIPFVLERFNFVAPLTEAGEQVTSLPDGPRERI